MENNSLEAHSIWHKYKTTVWSEESAPTHSAHNIVKTLRAIYNQNELAYLSTPITSGKVLYDVIEKTTLSSEARNFITGPYTSSEKIKRVPMYKDIIKKVMDTNYVKGYEFLEDLKKRLTIPILFPADLYPRGEKWSQDHFQALWTTLISEKCSELHMCKDWEYSNGAVEEFTHAYQLRLGVPKGFVGKDFSPFYNTKEGEEISRKRMRSIKSFNSKGNELSLEDGMKAVDRVLPWIKERNFNTEKLENARNILEWTGEMIQRGFYQ